MSQIPRIIEIIVVPRASTTEIVGYQGNALKIRLKAPPVDNAANEELIRFLAKHFDIPKSAITLLRGRTAKRKVVRISRPISLPDRTPHTAPPEKTA